jgi:hypothetical protein
MNSPGMIGSWPGRGSSVLPMMYGPPIPSRNPKCSRPVTGTLTGSRSIILSPPSSLASAAGSARASSAEAIISTPMWSELDPSGSRQPLGWFGPVSPRAALRAAMPTRNSPGKLASDSAGKPIAFSPE